MTEKEIQKKVERKLQFNMEMLGDVVWFTRLNSGMAHSGQQHIKLCEAGTPDIVAAIRCKDKGLALLFIECKRTEISHLSYEQQQFFNKMKGQLKILCVIINDINKLLPAIGEARLL